MKHSAQMLFKYLFILIFCILFWSFPFKASAQNISDQQQATANQYLNPNNDPNVPKNLHVYTQNILIDTLSAVACIITGIDPVSPKQGCLGVNNNGQMGLTKSGNGAIGVLMNLTSKLYTPPVNVTDYFVDLGNHFGPTKKAYASNPTSQLDHLSPIFSIWAAFRNVVYMMFIIVFILMGLAIMLRLKIDPRTVMTIQNQIPRIIIGLLLVTFSIAIAGLLIDLMYVVIYLVFQIILSADPKLMNYGLQSHFQGDNPVGYANLLKVHNDNGLVGGEGLVGIVTTVATSFHQIIYDLIYQSDVGFYIFNLLTIIGAVMAGPFSGLVLIGGGIINVTGFSNAIGAQVVGILTSIVVFLIVALAIFYALFRTWYMLLLAYVQILINIVLSPFWIVLSLVPGGKLGFGGWLRSMVANLAVFPAVIAMFLLGAVFMDKFTTDSKYGIFVAPLIANPNGGALGAFIGLGFIMMTPKVAEMIKTAIKAPSTGASGALSGLAPAASLVASPIAGTWGKLTSVNNQGEPTGALSRKLHEWTDPTKSQNVGRIRRYIGRAGSFAAGIAPHKKQANANPDT